MWRLSRYYWKQGAANASPQIAKKLIDKEVEVNLQNYSGETSLMEAFWRVNKEIVKLLIETGADLDIQNE